MKYGFRLSSRRVSKWRSIYKVATTHYYYFFWGTPGCHIIDQYTKLPLAHIRIRESGDRKHQNDVDFYKLIHKVFVRLDFLRCVYNKQSVNNSSIWWKQVLKTLTSVFSILKGTRILVVRKFPINSTPLFRFLFNGLFGLKKKNTNFLYHFLYSHFMFHKFQLLTYLLFFILNFDYFIRRVKQQVVFSEI